MVPDERIKYLFEQYLDKKYTPEERDELFRFINQEEYDSTLKQLINETWDTASQLHEPGREKSDAVFQNIIAHKAVPAGRIKRMPFLRYAAAAGIIGILLSVGAWFYFKDRGEQQIAKADTRQDSKNVITPGGDKAVLTLADGTQIILDSANTGTLTQQGNTKIIKLNSGELAYNTVNENPGEVLYNSISTPNGGQYQIVLDDGTKVWLNAASSLRFPTTFSGNERHVELTGEGYFEVAHNAKMPFHVKVNPASPAGREMDVKALGTKFNINSYPDEPTIKTTLLEGKVMVRREQKLVYLNPGQQAILQPGQENIRIAYDVNVAEVVAWKEGRFLFNGADLQTVMRQLARWYDVDFIYEKEIRETISGDLQRTENLSPFLKILEETGKLRFEISGKKITVKLK